MAIIDEYERKFLITHVEKRKIWEKEHIVYQWYVDVSDIFHKKKKIIFDLLKAIVIYVEITKEKKEIGHAKKEVFYLDIKDFKPRDMIGLPFVLKRRSICGGLFLDKMVASNGICEYLMEDEANEIERYRDDEFEVVGEVTGDDNYYNQNMCRLFTTQDAMYLEFLLNVFI